MSKFDSQIERMKQMMSYGISESKNASNNVEYHAKGADGKTYGIIRENSKFYIKVALPKDGEILAEDYDYIGGFRNRKFNEFLSYSNALKHLDLKLMSINEAYGKKDAVVESLNPYKKEDIIVEATEKMKEEIQRQREIMYNASNILGEGFSNIGIRNTGLPEAPNTATSKNGNLSSPFQIQAKAELDKDLKTTKNCPKNQGEPFEDDVNVDDADMKSDKMKKGSKEDNGKPFNKKAKYAPDNSVAAKKPSGGKVVKVNESEILTVNDNPDYMDTTKGTEIGNGAPFSKTNTIVNKENETVQEGCENCATWKQGDNQNSPKPGVSEVGDTAPFNKAVREKSCDDCCDDGELLDEMMEDDAENYAGFDDVDDDDETTFDDNEIDFVDDDEIDFSDEEANDFEENFGINPLFLGDDIEEPLKDDNTANAEIKINNIIDDIITGLRSSGSNISYDDLVKARAKVSDAYKIARESGIEKYQKAIKKDENGNPIKYKTDKHGRFSRKGKEMIPDENGSEWEYDELSPVYQRLDKLMNSIWARIEKIKGKEWDEEDNSIEYYNTSNDDLEYDDDDEFERESMNAPMYNESKKTKKKPVSEETTKLNDFGKHPAYRKKVMTLPNDTDFSKEGYDDWNDDSVKGDKPFGSQIGSSAPFDDKVKMITDAVMKRLKEAINNSKKKR